MNYETIFSVANYAVLPAWVLLALLPKADITKKLVHSGVYPVVYGLFYTVLIVRAMFFGQAEEAGNFSSLEGVMAAFTHPNVALMGWAHYLVFDLFVGAWVGRDAAARGVHHLLIIPCLFLTLMAGPVGLLLYLTLRQVTGKGQLTVLANGAS